MPYNWKQSEGKPRSDCVSVSRQPGLREFLNQLSKFADSMLFTAGLEVQCLTLQIFLPSILLVNVYSIVGMTICLQFFSSGCARPVVHQSDLGDLLSWWEEEKENTGGGGSVFCPAGTLLVLSSVCLCLLLCCLSPTGLLSSLTLSFQPCFPLLLPSNLILSTDVVS